MGDGTDRGFRRQTRTFWAALVLMVMVSLIAVLSTNRLVNAYYSSATSYQALAELDRYLSALKDVETSVRGYAMTRDRRFLDHYEGGIASHRNSRNELASLAGTEGALRPGLVDLNRLAQERLNVARKVVEQTTAGDRSGVVATIADGKKAMDAVRGKVASLRAAQAQAYEARRAVVGRQAMFANIALAAGMALGLLALAFVFRLFKQQLARRLLAENELRQLNAQLEDRVLKQTAEVEESRRMLAAIVENIPDAVYLKDPNDDFKYIMVNRACEELLGQARDKFIGHVDHELFPSEIATSRRLEDQEVAQSGKPIFVASRLLPTANGSRIVEVSKLPVQLEERGTPYILGIVRDITDKKQLEGQVREMQRLESVGLLTGGIAHDFNNLLAVIMGSLELLGLELPPGSEGEAVAEEAMQAVERGADLVRRLLAFARKQHLEPIAIDLNDRLPGIIPLLQRSIGEKISVKVDAASDLWPALIDPTQVDDALVNLAINARDAMPEGGSLVIETANVLLDEDYASHHAEVKPGEYVMLAVSDSGIGMDKATIERAFDPFFTTKPEGKGTGLGLSQVYGWVKQSGGHIKIYSEIGHGTAIKLYLPRAVQVADHVSVEPPEQVELTGNETILLVEDNPNVRRTVVRQLSHLGYNTIEVEDGESAYKMVVDGVKFDLLLTDVVMPGGMGGYDLAERVESLRPGVPILFTSGYTELAETTRAVPRSGRLLSKPYSRKDLGKAVRLALDDS